MVSWGIVVSYPPLITWCRCGREVARRALIITVISKYRLNKGERGFGGVREIRARVIN